MEDIKAYIESGVLELYVLGELSPEERLQVEEMAFRHPAVKSELEAIEHSLEQYAEENAVEPSEELRGRVLNSVLTNFNDDVNFKPSAAGITGKIVKLQPSGVHKFYKYAFAACLVLLIGSVAVLISLYNQLQDSNNQLAVLQQDKQHFANEVSLKDKELAQSQLEISVFRDASFKFLKLQGTVHAPAASITIAWSPANKKVMIDMGSVKMPLNDKNHQYQLWALVGSKPVSLGVFDKKPDSTDMKEMKSIADADAFAVTLEPRGGSVNPTMDQMMVLGKF